MKKMFSRMMSLALTLVMCIGMLNITAFAAEGRFNCDCETRHTHSEACWEKHANCRIEEGAVVCGDEEHPHEESCYHVHAEECYEDVLICGESVFHVHTGACFEKINGKAWMDRGTYRKYCVEPVCDFADMKIHGHEYSCLSEAEKTEILNSYPDSERAVPAFSDPYIFIEMQTYLPSGYYYHYPAANDDTHPQLWMMGDVRGMEKDSKWRHNLSTDTSPTDRFVPGESNFAVAYCCDVDTGVVQYHAYRQINLEDANYYNDRTAQKIRSVMMNSYPCLSVEEMQANLAAAGFADAEEVDEAAMIAAAQFAVWKYANSDSINDYHYWYTVPSGKYPVLTAHWEVNGAATYQPDTNERMLRVVDYLIAKAEANPIAAPQSQIIVSQVEVANLIMTPDENGTYTVDLKVKLNAKYDNSHEDTNIVITATAGEAIDSVEANGDSVYNLKLEGYTAGSDITVTMSGTQYLPLGVYFYEPYAAEGQDVRKVSQNLVGLNAGTIPVGDTVTLDGTKLATTGLVLKKVNETGKLLADAEFDLVYVDDDNVETTVGTYITDENGEVAIEGLMAGRTYYLTEVKAPEGYDAISGKVKLEVSEDGTTIAFNLPDGATCDSEADENYILTVVNCKTPYDLTVEKSLNGGDANVADEFTIVVTLDDTSINATYGDMEFVNGVATITLKGGERKTAVGLPFGIGYTITEPDSKGYEVSYSGCSGILNADHIAIVTNSKNSHVLGSIVVNKVTTGATTPAGATFQLQKLNGETWTNVGEAVPFSAFVNNAYTFTNLEEGTYRVIESGATIDGYTLETTYSDEVILTKTTAENGDTSVSIGSYVVTNEYEEDDELIEIPDEDPPLADVPKTGDMILPFAGMAIASGTAAIFVGKSVKKKDDEE